MNEPQINMKSQNDFPPAANGRKLTGRGFAIRIGAFFATIFIANGIMVFYALSTFDGVETENAYSKGRAYNHVLEAQAAQAALGWQVAISSHPEYIQQEIFLNITVTMVDEDNKAVALAPIPLSLRRPTRQGIDAAATLSPLGNGRYSGTVRLEEAGNWLAWFRATAPDGRSFVHEERLFVPPRPQHPVTGKAD